jgi:hypothetical protein
LLARCFGVKEPFGLLLPSLHEFFRFAVVGDGELQDGGLFGRDRTVDKLARGTSVGSLTLLSDRNALTRGHCCGKRQLL